MTSSASKPSFDIPLVLAGRTQEYAWGMGESSLVGRFSKNPSSSGKYAELWFGDHPNGPAVVESLQLSLRELITRYPAALLGNECVDRFGIRLPFLFKILSVGNALSIQAHPDAQHAPLLHKRSPEQYPDTFPKPEVGYALSEVELLYGFRAPEEILLFLTPGDHYVPEFAEMLSRNTLDSMHAMQSEPETFLKTLYSAVMNTPEKLLQTACQKLFARLAAKANRSPEEEWITVLEQSYPLGDVGLFSFFILNLVQLQPGSALFIGPNIPHAYLKNELAECMAPSDNVIRAGLTPKCMDIPTLLDLLEYQPQPPEPLFCQPDSTSSGYGEIDTPESEFFRLGVIEETREAIQCSTADKVELVFALEGQTLVATDAGEVRLAPGQAALIPARVAHYSVEVTRGKAFRVRTP